MNLKASLVLVSIFCYQISTSQRSGSQMGTSLADYLLIKQKDVFERMNPEIGGSPYLVDSFLPAIVHTKKTLFRGIPMRYNIYGDYIEFKEKEIVYILDPKPDLQKVEINTISLMVEPYEDHSKIKLGFFTLLDTGAVKLLQKKVVKFKESIPAQALQDRSTPAKYVPMPDEFYYRVRNQPAKIITSLKKIIDDFPDHKKELQSMISRRKLKTNEKDLRLLWEYYNKIRIKE